MVSATFRADSVVQPSYHLYAELQLAMHSFEEFRDPCSEPPTFCIPPGQTCVPPPCCYPPENPPIARGPGSTPPHPTPPKLGVLPPDFPYMYG